MAYTLGVIRSARHPAAAAMVHAHSKICFAAVSGLAVAVPETIWTNQSTNPVIANRCGGVVVRRLNAIRSDYAIASRFTRVTVSPAVDVRFVSVLDAVVAGGFCAKTTAARGALTIDILFTAFAIGAGWAAVASTIDVRFRRVFYAVRAGRHLAGAIGARAVDAI